MLRTKSTMLVLTALKALLILLLTSCTSIMFMDDAMETSITTEPVRTVCDVTPYAEMRMVGRAMVYSLSPLTNYYSSESYEFTCEADGYHKATVTVKRRLSPWLLSNALLLGGMPYGLAIDLALGTAWQFPGSVTIELEPTEDVID